MRSNESNKMFITLNPYNFLWDLYKTYKRDDHSPMLYSLNILAV